MSDEEPKDRLDPDKAKDPDDYVTQRRLRDLYDARKNLMARREKASELRITNGAFQGNRYYRKSVENYIMEVQPLFFQFDKEHLWHSEEFGSFKIGPPTEDLMDSYRHLGKQIEHDGEKYTLAGEVPEAKTFYIRGFETLYNQPSPLEIEFEFEVQRQLTVSGSIIKRTQVAIPEHILDRMVFTANTFLSEHGLDIGSEEGLPEDGLKL